MSHEPHGAPGDRLVVADGAPRRAGRRDLICVGCGYGVVVTEEPERCPLCGGADWDFAPWRPFSGGEPKLVA